MFGFGRKKVTEDGFGKKLLESISLAKEEFNTEEILQSKMNKKSPKKNSWTIALEKRRNSKRKKL